ncbi:hypothetical protein FFF34_000630 [Inquilinus sp. KBS0705]|nr:hypothetical protein FFF34_000630 [Inquilinus sp. KBS0705]
MKKAFQISVFTLLIVSAMFSSCKKITSKPDDKPFGPKTWLDGNWKLVKMKSEDLESGDSTIKNTGCEFATTYKFDRGTYIEKSGCSPFAETKYNYTYVESKPHNYIAFYNIDSKKGVYSQVIDIRTDSTYVTGDGSHTWIWRYFEKQR